MRLTRFSDYALRVLIFAATRPNELVTIAQVSAAYGISRNHLMKVTHRLATGGYLETVRGSGGGLRLARAAAKINIGSVLRATEERSELVECANRATNTCVIAPACALKHALFDALEAFYARLDKVTLADITRNPGALDLLFEKQMAS
ncbi:Rrf2 family transcriptional regulator [Aestuariivirga litoralis]|uniref:Rrf2 family transcriptional regulator n=1 Tax=Aestuariivirga litoralis TaxID=2650924 RepID=UPI0018C547EE|nr:Rrf2 family transcriptional regulator [Aestuariivirga litoralis]